MAMASSFNRHSTASGRHPEYLKGEHREIQEKIFNFFLSRTYLQTPVEISAADHRELCERQLTALVKYAGIRPLRYMMEDPALYFATLEAAGGIDISLGIKMVVQYSLWGGSVLNLGTKKHMDKYFDGIDNLDYPGCFAMTELHHGSTFRSVQTTATFDPITDEFIIHTPHDGAIKWWIGNAAVHGKFATVFARLMLPLQGKGGGPADMGVHAFIVPIRDMDTHLPLHGIEINDCGHKIGLNGVDNGALRFRSVRIPRDNLLNRFGDVARDGKYTSSLPNIIERYTATLGELVVGRVGLAYSSASVLKIATTIAVRYSLLRLHFGPPKEPEVRILGYQSQDKLMPMLASVYAFHFATRYLVDKYSEMKKSHDQVVVGDVHALSAGLKAYVTSYTAKSLSVCIELCGSHGYAAVNRFGSLRNDHDIFQTFEGDNTTLLVQVAVELLDRYKEKFRGGTLNVSWHYLRESMSSYLSRPNPVTAQWYGVAPLQDPTFQLDAFRYRTSRLLHGAAVRFNKHAGTLGYVGACDKCLNHLITLAESHIESVILAKFIESVQSCPDENTRHILKLVCDLYALDRIWKDIGTYPNVDYVAPIKAKAIYQLTESLCKLVRWCARELVDAFGFPGYVTRAPIGLSSDAYSQYTFSDSSMDALSSTT